MANIWSVFVNTYKTYGWTNSGQYMIKAGMTSLKVLPNLTYIFQDQVKVVGSAEPFDLPPIGGQYILGSGGAEVFEQKYTLQQVIGSTSVDVSTTVSSINTAINSAQSTLLNTLNNTTASLSGAISGVGNSIANNITAARQAIDNNINSAETSILSRVSSGITATATNIQNASTQILNKIQSNVGQIEQVQNALSSNIFTAANNTISSIGNSLNSITNNIINNVANATKNSDAYLNDVINGSTRSINGQISGVSNKLTATTEQINTNTNNAFAGVISGVTDALNPLNALAGLLGADYGNLVTKIIPDIGGDIGKSLARIQNAINKLLNDEYKSWDEFVLDLGVFQGNANLIETVFNITLVIPILLNLFQNAGSIYSQNITKLLMEEVRPTSLQSPDILKAMIREIITDDKAYELLGKLGIPDEFIHILRGNSKVYLDVNEVKNLFLRGLIDENTHDLKLSHLGFRDDDILAFKKLYFATPPANDLIRMAVREVFTPQTVKTYGMDQDFPSDFAKFGKEVGLDDHWSRAYWAAHWELPSPTMGFEMFHRGIITLDQLKELLKSLDVMPYWRDKLVNLSYNPVTRVDVRRLYNTGVISLNDVEKRYRDIGYSPTDAKLLTRWTEIDASPEDDTTEQEIKALSKSTLETAYKKGVITAEQTRISLADLGYQFHDIDILMAILDLAKLTDGDKDLSLEQEIKARKYTIDAYKRRTLSYDDARGQLLDLDISSNDIDIELGFADYEYQLSIKTSIVNKIQNMYLENTIDDVELTTYLSINGFNIKEVQQILDELIVLRSLRDRKPTKADFDKFLKVGVISTDEYIYELRGLGFADKYIDMYLNLSGDIEEE